MNPGREELGLAARVAVEAHTSVFVNALRSKDLATGGHRDGAEAGIAYVIAERYTAEAAYRWARERNVPASPVTAQVLPIEMSSVRGKLTAELPARWRSSVFGEVSRISKRRPGRFASVRHGCEEDPAMPPRKITSFAALRDQLGPAESTS